MENIVIKIIEETLETVQADKLLTAAWDRKKLQGDYHLLAMGKAACAMAEAAAEYDAVNLKSGLIITPHYTASSAIAGMKVLTASHPYPDESSLAAGEAVYQFINRLQVSDRILLLISGGASALVELPLKGVNISDISRITQQLQKAGADIIELNTVRKHLSQLKGGRLAKLAEPREIDAFLLSDVTDSRLDTIASGPAAADKTTSASALLILQNYDIKVSEQVKKAMRKETPAQINNVNNTIIGNNELLCHVVAEKALREGIIPWLLTTSMHGEASHYARMIPDIIRKVRLPNSKIKLPCLAICGGETTVTVKGKGKGGRNLELALAAAIEIRDQKKVTVAAVASDGRDGRTDFAGAHVDENSYDRMLSRGLMPEAYLKNNDSATALQRIDAVIQTGETNTNLNDLLLVLIEKID